MKIKLLYYILPLAIFSCQTGQNQTEKHSGDLPNYTLETLDSVTVKDILARLFLFQTADQDNIIFKDGASGKVFVFDREGNPIDQWEKTGDVPGAISMASGNLALDKAGNLVVLDIMNGLKVFKKNGSVIQNFGIYQNQRSLGSAFSHFKSYQVIEKEGKEYLLYSLDIIEEAPGEYGPEYLKTRKNLILTDLETEETKTFLPFPDGSQFLNGNVFLFSDFRPVFTYDGESQLLYLMFQNEPILYTYDWSGYGPVLKDKTNLDLSGFVAGEGFEKGAVSFGKISDYKINPAPSTVLNLEKYGKDLLITYKPTPADKGDLSLLMSGEASRELRARLSEETKKRTVVLTPKGDIIPLSLPEMNPYDFSIIGNDIWWIKKYGGDEEQEDFTVYRSRLLKEEISF
ncbi:NHL repeat-containing protein [Algoriphagus resistens]|uniref:hypothetical protein n=1 Tax=Algoriphagus resistens TaxID=1750590 RepID=UPI0007169C4F|nr:hypothetical protein [Algoriphagus resistens]